MGLKLGIRAHECTILIQSNHMNILTGFPYDRAKVRNNGLNWIPTRMEDVRPPKLFFHFFFITLFRKKLYFSHIEHCE